MRISRFERLMQATEDYRAGKLKVWDFIRLLENEGVNPPAINKLVLSGAIVRLTEHTYRRTSQEPQS